MLLSVITQTCPRLLLISAPRLGVYLFFVVDFVVCISVCLSVCHGAPNCFFFFVCRWNRAIFWPSVFHVALCKTVFLDFWFMPSNAQNVLPQICNCTKSPISRVSRLVWQIDQRCLRLPGGFRGCPIQWNHVQCCGADPCCHGNDIWPRRGDIIAYRLVNFNTSSTTCQCTELLLFE